MMVHVVSLNCPPTPSFASTCHNESYSGYNYLLEFDVLPCYKVPCPFQKWQQGTWVGGPLYINYVLATAAHVQSGDRPSRNTFFSLYCEAGLLLHEEKCLDQGELDSDRCQPL